MDVNVSDDDDADGDGDFILMKSPVLGFVFFFFLRKDSQREVYDKTVSQHTNKTGDNVTIAILRADAQFGNLQS